MGEHNSPFYAAGLELGELDTQAIASCPPGEPQGPDPDRSWSIMYMRGYNTTFDPGMAHVCTRECRQ